MDLRLSSVHVYPVKSCRGLSPSRWRVGRRGFLYDREWMVTDAKGHFLTQREEPRMALIGTDFRDGGLVLEAPGMPELPAAALQPGSEGEAEVWEDRVRVEDQGEEAAAWLSAFLGRPCRLVRAALSFRRDVRLQGEVVAEDGVAFADAFPFLLLTEASLSDLNARLPAPVSAERFRPNLVVEGAEPYAEDRWRLLRIGSLEFRLVKPCARCSIPSVDPSTGERGREPLATLASYRRREGKVLFGMNAVHRGEGVLAAGDAVQVLEEAP